MAWSERGPRASRGVSDHAKIGVTVPAQGLRVCWRIGAGVLAAALVQAGCVQKPVPVRYTGPVVGYGAGPIASDAAVFASRDASRTGEGEAANRLDHRLSHAGSGSHAAMNAWPSEPRPSLASARRLTFSRSANQWVYVPAPGSAAPSPRVIRQPVFVPVPRAPAVRPGPRPPIYVPYEPSHPHRPGHPY